MLKGRSFLYKVYGLVVSSEFELKELDPCERPQSVDVTVKYSKLGLFHPDANQEFSFSKHRQKIILPAVGAFILEGSSTVYVEPKPGVSEDLLAVPLLGPILAILLHLRGLFILHGSAIVYEGKAYGFVGDKGAGKSTLASMLLKNPDVQFLTDDLLVVSRKLEVLRGYPQMKLSDEALSHSDQKLGKVRPPPIQEFPKHQFLLGERLPFAKVPLGGIFELRRSLHTAIEHLTPAEGISTLLRFSYISRFRKRQIGYEERRELFAITTKIASSNLVNRITVPNRIDELHRVVGVLSSDST